MWRSVLLVLFGVMLGGVGVFFSYHKRTSSLTSPFFDGPSSRGDASGLDDTATVSGSNGSAQRSNHTTPFSLHHDQVNEIGYMILGHLVGGTVSVDFSCDDCVIGFDVIESRGFLVYTFYDKDQRTLNCSELDQCPYDDVMHIAYHLYTGVVSVYRSDDYWEEVLKMDGDVLRGIYDSERITP